MALPSARLPHTLADQARDRLREEITTKRLSQKDLEGLLGEGWSQSRISKILCGTTELTVNDLAALCFALSLSVVEVLRDPGFEFVAEMTPLELRILERFRAVTQAERDAYAIILEMRLARPQGPRPALPLPRDLRRK